MQATTDMKKVRHIVCLSIWMQAWHGSGSAIQTRRESGAGAKWTRIIPLPDCLKERLCSGELLAPTLREECRADGERIAVLDFIIEVEKRSCPLGKTLSESWAQTGAIHSLLTATAVDAHSEQMGRPFFFNTGGF